MSELSMDELLAETGELLPERETLGTVSISQSGVATATQSNFLGAIGNSNSATNLQVAHVTYDSFNSYHTFFGFI